MPFILFLLPISCVGIYFGTWFYGLVPMIVLIIHTVILIQNFIEKQKMDLFWNRIGIVCIGFAILQ
jgi:hypothetical protein